ncbi:ABC transporter permease [Nitratireductor mangrovi]|uniref:ABC transporter permease n=1 Tax=Nitratireductor mangrovi TaxID=2599600 RepID=A0A5B8KVA9_9HYPH|nr:ABC transporter permease [Nitratireductor mangrovi]QDY99596.1 ABC transporter permease [Nitratireductor mangrovi]
MAILSNRRTDNPPQPLESIPRPLFSRCPPSVVLAFAAVTIVVAISALGPLLVRDPNAQDLLAVMRPPLARGNVGTYLLGTDQLGRDLLARLVTGMRTSLLITLFAVLIGGVFGTAIGLASGYLGGRVDNLLMRTVDIQLAVPGVLLVLTLAAVLRPGVGTTICVLSLIVWVVYARVARAQVLSLRETDLVLAARATGCSDMRILLYHVLPNIAGPIWVITTLEFAHVMIAEAALGYLGLGVPPPAPTLGAMIAEGQRYLQLGKWWLVVMPGFVVTLTIISINTVGNWLRDTLDPRSRSRVG